MFAIMASPPDSVVQLSQPQEYYPSALLVSLTSDQDTKITRCNFIQAMFNNGRAKVIPRIVPILGILYDLRARMSAKRSWDWAASAGLLTNEECSMLLDVDFFDDEDDLLKTLPTGPSKNEAAPKLPLFIEDTTSLYPPSPPSPPETKPSRSELANDLLMQLDDSDCKQENIFSNWLEEKVDVPIFESIPQPAATRVESYTQPQPTEELLREFETVYGAVELTHLTPPQSPPLPATQLLLSYAQQAGLPQPQWQHDIQQPYYDELQAVEELVRNRAAELTSPISESPRSSPPSSPRSSTDEEWTSSTRKPYSRGGDDRRSRKKEQNKNAATRYRQKKKQEIEVLLGEESALRSRHNELGDKCADLQREIKYLKGLMRDLFKAKGLIK